MIPDNPSLPAATNIEPPPQGKLARLLVLGDSPTLQSGFARVLQNLLPRWQASGRFERIDVWGIGHEGWPHELPWRIFPAQSYQDREWYASENLERFLMFLRGGDYTHLFLLQDLFHLSRMADSLRKVCRSYGVRSLLYYPVDAPVDALWTRIVLAVDEAVAYTEYGYAEVRKHRGTENLRKRILPHGTDVAVYYPEKDRLAGRSFFRDQDGKHILRDDDFLILNVNAHQKRKGLFQTLLLFGRLKALWKQPRRLRLYLHMPPVNTGEQSDLRNLVVQLGLEEDVLLADNVFVGNASRVGEAHLRALYNAADLFLTTSLGEGWGLTVTEAMACGCPVAAPGHTALVEMLTAGGRGIMLPLSAESVVLPGDNMRIRPLIDIEASAEKLSEAIGLPYSEAASLGSRAGHAMEWVGREEFRWPHIADRWLELMFPS